MNLQAAKAALRDKADPKKAVFLQSYFRTEKGGYGEGDIFLGVAVPDTRAIARRFRELGGKEVATLVRSKFHEERLLGLLVLVDRFGRADDRERERIYRFYMSDVQRRKVNNWDLVDTSAEYVVGAWLAGKTAAERRRVLGSLARSRNVWDRRIAVLATRNLLKQRRFDDTLWIARTLLTDEHDLIHKAVGWLLREIGDRDRALEERFLKANLEKMPRTMLRYAIEKFPPALRKAYLTGSIRD